MNGQILQTTGEYGLAETAYQESFTLLEDQYVVGFARTHKMLGIFYLVQDQDEKARKHLQQALQIFESLSIHREVEEVNALLI